MIAPRPLQINKGPGARPSEYRGPANFHRSFAVLLLAASLSSGVLAQRHVPVDDETIFVAVEGALHEERSLARAEITVHSRDGFVTLTGFAATWQDVATAGRLASRVRGVTGINNRILVANPARGA